MEFLIFFLIFPFLNLKNVMAFSCYFCEDWSPDVKSPCFINVKGIAACEENRCQLVPHRVLKYKSKKRSVPNLRKFKRKKGDNTFPEYTHIHKVYRSCYKKDEDCDFVKKKWRNMEPNYIVWDDSCRVITCNKEECNGENLTIRDIALKIENSTSKPNFNYYTYLIYFYLVMNFVFVF